MPPLGPGIRILLKDYPDLPIDVLLARGIDTVQSLVLAIELSPQEMESVLESSLKISFGEFRESLLQYGIPWFVPGFERQYSISRPFPPKHLQASSIVPRIIPDQTQVSPPPFSQDLSTTLRGGGLIATDTTGASESYSARDLIAKVDRSFYENLMPYEVNELPLISTETKKHAEISLNVKQNLDALLSALTLNFMVVISIPVFDWYHSPWGDLSGIVTMPTPPDLSAQGSIDLHEVVLRGFQSDSASAGGGFFIFDPGWGPDWAKFNYFAPGLGTLPYAYVSEYCHNAVAIAPQFHYCAANEEQWKQLNASKNQLIRNLDQWRCSFNLLNNPSRVFDDSALVEFTQSLKFKGGGLAHANFASLKKAEANIDFDQVLADTFALFGIGRQYFSYVRDHECTKPGTCEPKINSLCTSNC